MRRKCSKKEQLEYLGNDTENYNTLFIGRFKGINNGRSFQPFVHRSNVFATFII